MSLILVARRYTDPQMQELVRKVQAEYVVRYGSPDESPIDPADFDPPNGLLLLGLVDGEPVASGGWRRKGDDVGGVVEIRRMYVVPAVRGRGYARAMLAELERTAAAAGASRVVLNTGIEQPEAIALYDSCGYRPVEPFGHYREAPGAVFLGRDLPAAD